MRVIPLKNLKYWVKKDWQEWPIFTPEDFGLTKDDDLTELGELVKAVQTSLNQGLNLDTLDDIELHQYAREMNINVDYLEDTETLRARVQAA